MTGNFGKIDGPKEYKGYIVVSQVEDAYGLHIFHLAESFSDTPIRVRIWKKDPNLDALVEKVDSLFREQVDVVIHRSPWSIGNKRGIVNYLQSIEKSQ